MQDCLARDPYNFQTQLNLGALLHQQKKWAEARLHLEFVKRYFPTATRELTLCSSKSTTHSATRALLRTQCASGYACSPTISDLKRLNLIH